MKTAMAFANTWIHEAIHSSHVVSGIYTIWTNRFGDDEARRITEFYAHSTVDQMTGSNIKFSPAIETYFPSIYFQSFLSIPYR